jgi:hypothetical protein
VAHLPDDTKDDVRVALGERAFSKPEPAAKDASTNDSNSGEIALLLAKVLGIISKFGDKK